MKRHVAVILLAVSVLALAAATASAAFPGRNGAFAKGWWDTGVGYSEEDGGEANRVERAIRLGGRTLFDCTDVYAFGADSECERQHYGDPAVAPDGRRVLFDAGATLAIVGSDGSGFQLLPGHGEDDGAPAFSPRGGRIVFGSGAPRLTGQRPRRDVWIADADGTHARVLVRDGDWPVWSTRNWIAFVRGGSIYRIRPDGSGLRLIVRAGYVPTWSPGGTRLAFTADGRIHGGRWARRAGVYVAHADGTHVRRLHGRAAQDSVSDMAWSPDGRQLLTQSIDLMTIDLDGRLVRNHGGTESIGADYHTETPGIDWQPLPRRR